MPLVKTCLKEFERARRQAALEPADAAAVELARSCARAIDSGQLRFVRPYLDVLVELGMTPKARAALLKDMPKQPQSAPGLDELRSRRERNA